MKETSPSGRELEILKVLLKLVTKTFSVAVVVFGLSVASWAIAEETVKVPVNEAVEIAADPKAGFNYPYYLFVPDTVKKEANVRLFVEPNNTGTGSDDFKVHLKGARKLIEQSYPNRIVRKLGTPLLVPVFPRLRSNWLAYTHSLDRDTLEIEKGPLKRLDLQLIAMIEHASSLLRAEGYSIDKQIFMHGFSASAKFCNRFAFLHPKRVKALAAGGVNGLPTLPIAARKGQALPFPIGIADIELFTGHPYDAEAHRRVAQYIYMGYLDRNDTLPYRDAWSTEEADIIKSALVEKMMPDRWEMSQAIYRDKLPRSQCVTYNGTGHEVKKEIIDDLVKFFRANSGDAFVAIEPHEYPFVEYRELRKVHITAILNRDDAEEIPEFARKSARVFAKKNGKKSFYFLRIKEWIPTQKYGQLNRFFDNAGFNFRLHAEGHPDIIITRANYCGSMSSGDGQFQAYFLKLDESESESLAQGVPYSLSPANQSNDYFWIVDEGVALTKPASKDK